MMSSLRKRTVTVGVGANLYEQSGELEEYRDGFVVTDIDGRDNSLEFANGIRLRDSVQIAEVALIANGALEAAYHVVIFLLKHAGVQTAGPTTGA